jgi:hypothetical protein
MKEPQSLCQEQINFYVHEMMTSSCERDWRKNGRKKGKKVC